MRSYVLLAIAFAGCAPHEANRADAMPETSAPASSPGGGSTDASSPDPSVAPKAAWKLAAEPPIEGRHVTPRLVWTGSVFAAVWAEIDVERGWFPEDEPVDEVSMTDLAKADSFVIRLAVLDPATGAVGDPVTLEGAGSGPPALSGPVFALPAWSGGAVTLGWALWNDETGKGKVPPARYVIGRWGLDGKPVGKPVIVAKEPLLDLPGKTYDIHLVPTKGAVTLLWPSSAHDDTCKEICGPMGSVAFATMELDGTVTSDFACADNMEGMGTARYGDSVLVMMLNTHVYYHTWLMCFPDADGCYREYEEGRNPLERMISTGAGFAVWYGQYNQETNKLTGRCVDIQLAGGEAVDCARPRSERIEWGGEGLRIVIEAKDGKSYYLPFLPGDHVQPGLLRKALVEKKPVLDAVMGTGSLAIAWVKNGEVKLRVIGPDGMAHD